MKSSKFDTRRNSSYCSIILHFTALQLILMFGIFYTRSSGSLELELKLQVAQGNRVRPMKEKKVYLIAYYALGLFIPIFKEDPLCVFWEFICWNVMTFQYFIVSSIFLLESRIISKESFATIKHIYRSKGLSCVVHIFLYFRLYTYIQLAKLLFPTQIIRAKNFAKWLWPNEIYSISTVIYQKFSKAI